MRFCVVRSHGGKYWGTGHIHDLFVNVSIAWVHRFGSPDEYGGLVVVVVVGGRDLQNLLLYIYIYIYTYIYTYIYMDSIYLFITHSLID